MPRPLRCFALALLFTLVSCMKTPSTPGAEPPPPLLPVPTEPVVPAPESFGLLEVQFSLSEGGLATSSAQWLPAAEGLEPNSISNSIQLESVSVTTFTFGLRGAGGERYIAASYRVRNADMDGNAYATERQNLTFLSVITPDTLLKTSVRRMNRFNETPADAAIARTLLPLHAMELAPDGVRARVRSDFESLQIFTEADIAAFSPAPTVLSILPHGFVVRCVNNCLPNSRRLAASPAEGAFDGLVTFAVKLPLQATAADDTFNFSLMFQAVDDPITRVSHNLEPLDDTAAARAAQFSTPVLVVPGLTTFSSVMTKLVCGLRLYGTFDDPDSLLLLGTPEVCVNWNEGLWDVGYWQ